ncbi:MAG: methyltransferase domain-containing protein [Thaumarchaeota archaeon]|nr:methyltransferase domain-containing protein [Nitrososphaerota archaeon]
MNQDWRGRSEATQKGELTHIFNTIAVTENNSFCDLGCGKGHLCIHARNWVGKSAGFETKKTRYRIAKNKVKKSGIDKIKIFNKSYEHKKSFKIIQQYNIIFCVNELTKEYLEKLGKTLKPNSKIILYDLPPIPFKPVKKIGWYYILKTPLKKSKSEKDWILSVSGKKAITRTELFKMIRNNFRDDYSERILDVSKKLDSIFE